MSQLSAQGAVTPNIRAVAASCVVGLVRDPVGQADALAQWVGEHVQFLADPTVAEALTPPPDALATIQRQGFVQMDCDDVAMLAAALGLSIGLRARFVAVAFGDPTAPFAHVFTQLGDPSGVTWLTVDPTRPTLDLPPVSRTMVLEV